MVTDEAVAITTQVQTRQVNKTALEKLVKFLDTFGRKLMISLCLSKLIAMTTVAFIFILQKA